MNAIIFPGFRWFFEII